MTDTCRAHFHDNVSDANYDRWKLLNEEDERTGRGVQRKNPGPETRSELPLAFFAVPAALKGVEGIRPASISVFEGMAKVDLQITVSIPADCKDIAWAIGSELIRLADELGSPK